MSEISSKTKNQEGPPAGMKSGGLSIKTSRYADYTGWLTVTGSQPATEWDETLKHQILLKVTKKGLLIIDCKKTNRIYYA